MREPKGRIGYARDVSRTVIVPEAVIRSLVEANASLAAWYHAFIRASREQTPVTTPSEEERRAFLERIGRDFPEIAHVVSAITAPRVYVPPPLPLSGQGLPADPTVPPLVDPTKVKYPAK